MRDALMAIAAVFVLSGGASASESNSSASDADEAAADRQADEAQSFRHDDSTDALPPRTADDDLLIEAIWPFCGCSKEEFDALVEAYDKLDVALEEKSRELGDLKLSATRARESYKHVELPVVKKALLTHDLYDAAAVRQKGHDNVITTWVYDSLTIDAVEEYQCRRYGTMTGNDCDSRQATGWLTFWEAREAICSAGLLAEDEVALKLADWLASGYVFNRNLDLSSKIVDELLDNLKLYLSNPNPPKNRYFYERSYYQDIESRARSFKSKLAGLIEIEKEQIAARNRDARARHKGGGEPELETYNVWEKGLTPEEVCQSPLQRDETKAPAQKSSSKPQKQSN
jgi:hypothetical protein